MRFLDRQQGYLDMKEQGLIALNRKIIGADRFVTSCNYASFCVWMYP